MLSRSARAAHASALLAVTPGPELPIASCKPREQATESGEKLKRCLSFSQLAYIQRK